MNLINTDLKFDEEVIPIKLARDFSLLKMPDSEKPLLQFEHPMFRDKNGLVINYAPWCLHCQEFAPTVNKLAKVTKGLYPIGVINVEDNSAGNNILADYLKVTGYPTIKLWENGTFKDYSGGRSLEALLRHLCMRNGLCELV